MANVGYATLSVIPSLKGAGAALTGQLSGPAGAAGAQAGGLFGGAFGGALGGVLAGGAAVAGIGAGLVAIGGSFDEAFDTIRLKTGATGQELAGLKDVFRDVVSDVPTDFGSAATAIGGLQQRLHLSGGDLENVSERVLELSRITDTDLAGNVDSVTRLFGDWGISTDDMGERLDQLFRTSQMSGVGVADLARNVTNFGSPLRQLGFGLTDSLAMLGRFEAEGVNTSTVMSGMRQAVKNFGSGMAEEKAGVSDFQDVIEGVKDGTFTLTDAMTVFGARAGTDVFKAIQEGRFELGRYSRQISEGSDTILGAAEDTNDWRESLTQLKNRALVFIEPLATRLFNALGSGADFIVSLTDAFGEGGLTGVMDSLKSKFSGLSGPMKIFVGVAGALAAGLGAAGLVGILGLIGGAITAIFSPIVLVVGGLALLAAGAVYAYQHFEGFRNVVDGVVSWLVGTAWPWVQQFAAGIISAFQSAVAWVQARWPAIQEAVGHVLTVVMTILRGAWTVITGIWRAIGDDVLNIVRTAWNFVTSIISAAMQVVRGVIDVVLGVINGDWSRAWNGIKSIFAGVWNAIKAIVRGAFGVVRSILAGGLSVLQALWRTAWSAIRAALSAAWSAIRSVVSAAWNAVRSLITGGLSALSGAWRAGWSAIRTALSSAWQAMRSATSTAWNGIRSVVRSGIDAVVGFVRGLPGRIASLASGAWDSLTNGFRTAINAIIDMWNSVDLTFEGYDIPGPGPNIPGFTIGLPDLPHLAEGGTLTRSGSVLIGEDGPEILDLPSGARVTPLDQHYVNQACAASVDARVVLDVTGGPPEMVRLIRKMIRVEGGDVQVVLGS